MYFSPDDTTGPNGWTTVDVIGNQDDGCTGALPLGFTYNGFGANTTNVTVSTNGVLFLGTNCSTAHINTALPSSISTDPMLFFFWDDMRDFGGGEFVRYRTYGTAGGRVFNLYYRYRLFSNACGTDVVQVMMSVHESSNLVTATYTGDIIACDPLKGGSATFGFQGTGGSSAKSFMIGYDAVVLDDNAANNTEQSMSFHPPN
jgi:hypothetical protein